MKLFKRYFCVFLCLLLSFGLFSLPVSAETSSLDSYKVNILGQAGELGSFGQIDISNGQTGQKDIDLNKTIKPNDWLIFSYLLTFADGSGKPLFKSGQESTFKASNFVFASGFTLVDGSLAMLSGPDLMYISDCYLIYTDNTRESIDVNWEFNNVNLTYSFSLTVNPSRDVQKLFIAFNREVTTRVMNEYGGAKYNVDAPLNMTFGSSTSHPLGIDIEIEEKEVGLLRSIIDWLSNISSSISNLPMAIWNRISNGLYNLFIPNNAYFENWFSRWDEMLATRLGGLYEVVGIVHDSWDGIMQADQTDTINIPNVSIPIGDNETFSFGGYDVKIVPEGFEGLVETLKTLVGIICTVAFINGLIKRYDEIIGAKD